MFAERIDPIQAAQQILHNEGMLCFKPGQTESTTTESLLVEVLASANEGLSIDLIERIQAHLVGSGAITAIS